MVVDTTKTFSEVIFPVKILCMLCMLSRHLWTQIGALASTYRGWGISAEFEPRSVFHGDLAELLEDQSGIWNLQAHFTESTKSETVEVLQTKKYKRMETYGGF